MTPTSKAVPPIATLASDLFRRTPRWTKSRAIALNLFPKLFFDRSSEYVAPLANSNARVWCSPATPMECSVLSLGVWEEEESAFMDRTIRNGWTAIDLGANVGLHTCRIASLVGTAGKVYAIEPNAVLHPRLAGNLELNGFKNVRVIQCAVSDTPGGGTLFVNKPGHPSRNATLVHDPETPEVVGQSVRLRTLDDCWVNEMESRKIDFIKLDIEGYEITALRSGNEMLRTCRPIILSEYSQYYASLLGYGWSDVHSTLKGFGYKVLNLSGKPLPSDREYSLRTGFDYVALPC